MPTKEVTTIDPLSFMQIMEQDNEDTMLSTSTKASFDSTLLFDSDSNKIPEAFDYDSLFGEANKNIIDAYYEEEDCDDISNDKDYEPTNRADEYNDDESDIDYETQDEDDDDDYVKKKRRKKINKNCLDDGDDRLYAKRLKRLEKYERFLAAQEDANNNKESANSDEELEDLEKELENQAEYNAEILDEDLEEEVDEEDLELEKREESGKDFVLNNNRHIEIDNGFKVPENIWNRLYKFQKTALKWFWELHSQRCGGILGGNI